METEDAKNMNAREAIRQVREEQQPPTDPAAVVSDSPATPVEAPPASTAPEAEAKWEPWMDTALAMCKERFINERVKGFTHPRTGATYPPVPPEEAEQRWMKVEPMFRKVLVTDQSVRVKFIGSKEGASEPVTAPSAAPAAPTDQPPPTPVSEPPPTEPDEPSDAVTGVGDK